MTPTRTVALISAVGGLLAIGVYGKQLWPVAGWMTPDSHNADILETIGEVKEFRDEWKCDEYEEELVELMKQQAAGDSSIETKRKVERLREKIDKLNCERFED